MKLIKRFLTLAATVALGGEMAQALPVGDNAEIFVTGDVGARADSNIFLTSRKTSDTIVEATPGLELSFGKNSATTGSLTAAEDFSFYTTHTNLNSSLANTALNTNYQDGKTKLGIRASYSEVNQNTVDIHNADELVRRNLTHLGGTGEIALSLKTSMEAGMQYDNTDYRKTGYSDLTTFWIPMNFYYELTPKVDVGFGYQYRSNWQQIGADSQDHFFHFSSRGEFTPKLSGSVNIGVTKRHFDSSPKIAGVGRNESLLGIDSNLTYAVTPKVNAQLGVSNDFGANAFGQQQKNFSINGLVQLKFAPELQATAGVSYRAIDYFT
ncbi:MAG TPA: hypothetical protein VG710_04670, partial [Opitutus sp.]|nr:hypothetical protein [Opitutus sp.]